MKIRELSARLYRAAEDASTIQVGNAYGVSYNLLTEALAEQDAKMQEFDAYWEKYILDWVGDPECAAIARTILDALQVAFEVPTKKPELEKGAR